MDIILVVDDITIIAAEATMVGAVGGSSLAVEEGLLEWVAILQLDEATEEIMEII